MFQSAQRSSRNVAAPGSVHLPGEQRILNPAIRAIDRRLHRYFQDRESLVDLGADGKPTPVLATSWEATPDGKTVTFKLREGVNWHDGKPSRSADVQYPRWRLEENT